MGVFVYKSNLLVWVGFGSTWLDLSGAKLDLYFKVEKGRLGASAASLSDPYFCV